MRRVIRKKEKKFLLTVLLPMPLTLQLRMAFLPWTAVTFLDWSITTQGTGWGRAKSEAGRLVAGES